MKFFLGTHIPSWLSRASVPLFVSARRLRMGTPKRKATCTWALDSGGFSELSMFGEWRTPAKQYAIEAVYWSGVLGGMEWAAVQDWMCEPPVLQKTGLTIARHQALTIASFEQLLTLAPKVPWAPVLQGYALQDYEAHAVEYERRGHDLSAAPIVGVGSICRRQGTLEVERIMRTLSTRVPRLHAFGAKLTGLRLYSDVLCSADSLAWSYDARRTPVRMPGHSHKNCANCYEFAMTWRERAIVSIGQ